MLPNISNCLPKWRNFAKSGHTDLREPVSGLFKVPLVATKTKLTSTSVIEFPKTFWISISASRTCFEAVVGTYFTRHQKFPKKSFSLILRLAALFRVTSHYAEIIYYLSSVTRCWNKKLSNLQQKLPKKYPHQINLKSAFFTIAHNCC